LRSFTAPRLNLTEKNLREPFDDMQYYLPNGVGNISVCGKDVGEKKRDP
jgi:hypothetical protein